MKKQKAFTLVELLVVISIIGLLASILLVAFSGVNAKGRDAKREIEVSSISKALEYHYLEKGEYPIIVSWVSIEEDATFSTDMNEYLTDIPEDPLYGQTGDGGEPYSYQYMSSDDGQHYAIKILYEKKGSVITYSSPEGELAMTGFICGDAVCDPGETCPADCGSGMDGNGTPGEPYIIVNVNQLQEMSNNLSAYYELGQNINASDTINWNGGAGFEPIGCASSRSMSCGSRPVSQSFTGNFDGKDYKITELYINRSSEGYIGLFGSSNGEVKNVGLEGITIIGGGEYAAGLVSYNTGIITNSYVSGSVNASFNVGGLVGENMGGTITDSYATGNVTGGGQVGGLVGASVLGGTITNSYATGNVTGATDYIGGLIAWNAGTVTNSYATGTVTGGFYIGGLIAWNAGTVTNSYATGDATGTGSIIGGLVGQNTDTGTIINSYGTGSIAGNNFIGGLAGFNQSGTITNGYWGNNPSLTCCGMGSCNSCTEEADVTNFYFRFQDVYDTNSPVWDFFTPIWVEIPSNYPVLLP